LAEEASKNNGKIQTELLLVTNTHKQYHECQQQVKTDIAVDVILEMCQLSNWSLEFLIRILESTRMKTEAKIIYFLSFFLKSAAG